MVTLQEPAPNGSQQHGHWMKVHRHWYKCLAAGLGLVWHQAYQIIAAVMKHNSCDLLCVPIKVEYDLGGD